MERAVEVVRAPRKREKKCKSGDPVCTEIYLKICKTICFTTEDGKKTERMVSENSTLRDGLHTLQFDCQFVSLLFSSNPGSRVKRSSLAVILQWSLCCRSVVPRRSMEAKENKTQTHDTRTRNKARNEFQ